MCYSRRQKHTIVKEGIRENVEVILIVFTDGCEACQPACEGLTFCHKPVNYQKWFKDAATEVYANKVEGNNNALKQDITHWV